MIAVTELRQMANARLEDARALHDAEHYDAAMYLCGYGVELALKARICETLGWIEFPESRNEFQDYRSLQTHDLDVLLDFSGIHNRVRNEYKDLWEVASKWSHNWRYRPIESASESTCMEMLDAVTGLMEIL